jgi:hypothetical protein
VYLANNVRLGQYQQVVVAFHIDRMIRESLALTTIIAMHNCAAIVFLGQFVTLDHRTHRAIQNQDALLDELFYQVRGVVHGVQRKK